MASEIEFDLSDFPKELKLILSILKTGSDNGVHFNRSELFSDIDWKLFIKLAMYHRVYPIIYLQLKKMDQNLIPKNVIETVRTEYNKNTFRMLFLSREIEKISRLFLENNIRMLVLKGPVLAHDLYGNISLRTSLDIDILVSLPDLDKVDELLLQIGYVKHEFFSTFLDDWKWRIHHLDYIHHQGNFLLEVHWRFHPGPVKEPNFDELWERKRKSTLTNYPVYYFGQEDLFLYLVTHGARHGWSQLSWLVDIDKVVEKGFDLGKLNKLLKKYQCLHIGGQALILISELFNTATIEQTNILKIGKKSRKLARKALFFIKEIVTIDEDQITKDINDYFNSYLSSLLSTQQKLIFVLNFFYPYPMDAEIIRLPRGLRFLYVPLRPFLWAWRKSKKENF